MAITVFPRVGVRSATPSLRRGHWSTDGLVTVVPFSGGAAVSVEKHVKALIVSTPNTLQGIESVSYNFHGGRAELFDAGQIPKLPTARVTVLFVQRNNAAPAFAYAWGYSSSTVGEYLGLTCPWTDGKVYWAFGSLQATTAATGLAAQGEIHAWACVAGALGLSIYRDGVQVATNSTPQTRTNGVIGTKSFGLNAGVGQSGQLQDIYFFALLDAEWTPTQVAEWSVNPWLMFETGYPFAPAPGTAAAATHLSPFLVGCST